MPEKTIDKLVSIAEKVTRKITSKQLQESTEEFIKSPTVFHKTCDLFEYAAEIMGLAKNNDKFAKTNAVLLRVLLEILINILLIKNHVEKYKTMQEQEEIIKAFELKFCKEKLHHLRRREEALQKIKNVPDIADDKIKNIKKQKKQLEQKIQEHKKKTNNKDLLKLIADNNIHNQAASIFQEKEGRYTFSALYQNCSQYIHPDHTLSEEKELAKDLSKIEGIFTAIILDFDTICQNKILSNKDRKYLQEIINRSEKTN